MTSPVDPWWNAVAARLETPAPSRLKPKKRDVRPAAVLVPLYVDARQLWTILTRRTDQLPTHKGQIAFPGGARELGESPWDAALREAQEEIGLLKQSVLPLGTLDEVETPAGFHVVPCVGVVPAGFVPEIDAGEIAEVFSLPLSALVNPSLVEDRRVRLDGVERSLRIYHVGRHQIWGLTARVLQNLLLRLGLEGDDPEASPPV